MNVTTTNAAIAPAAPASRSGNEPAAAMRGQQDPAPTPEVPAVQARTTEDAQLKIAEQVQRYLQSTTRNLEFQVEDESGAAVIVVRDVTGQVIRRIPGEEALQLMRRLNAQSGTLVDSSA